MTSSSCNELARLIESVRISDEENTGDLDIEGTLDKNRARITEGDSPDVDEPSDPTANGSDVKMGVPVVDRATSSDRLCG